MFPRIFGSSSNSAQVQPETNNSAQSDSTASNSNVHSNGVATSVFNQANLDAPANLPARIRPSNNQSSSSNRPTGPNAGLGIRGLAERNTRNIFGPFGAVPTAIEINSASINILSVEGQNQTPFNEFIDLFTNTSGPRGIFGGIFTSGTRRSSAIEASISVIKGRMHDIYTSGAELRAFDDPQIKDEFRRMLDSCSQDEVALIQNKMGLAIFEAGIANSLPGVRRDDRLVDLEINLMQDLLDSLP